VQIFDATETARRLPFEGLIPALRKRFVEGCEAPPRQVLTLDDPAGGPAMTSLVMPAWVPGRYYGLKCINIAPGNALRGLPGLHASYLLNDAVSGVPVALIDGDTLTARRTAATSALAADLLASPDARHLLVIGAGRIAALLPAAHASVRPHLTRISLWARNADQARALAKSLSAQGLPVRAVGDLAAAAAQADIVSCATLATSPVVLGSWLSARSHLDLIGSFTPAMREADDASFRDARVVVDTLEALAKSGELIGPLARGVLQADAIATLADLLRGHAYERSTAATRTVFKSVGHALEDLAAAMLVVDGT
jgi:ornithine cyclodeaminase/alanine dehydrogenase-like protein (mu-crystallin family)